MNFKEMSNEHLMRCYICSKRELKTLQSTIKQEEEELNSRFDLGKLDEKENRKDGNK